MRRARSASLHRRLHGIMAQCTALFAGIFNPYRPELHYMRGPGPKWHAARARQLGR
jgi:hypothetical protein